MGWDRIASVLGSKINSLILAQNEVKQLTNIYRDF